jgi:hypothetical protein
VIDLRVARVGDGACAAIYTGAGRQVAAIIDCGSMQGGAEAADGLRRIVDLPVRRPTTIVVTHLHADHYSGLVHLASSSTTPRFFKLRLVQAALPRSAQLEAFTARYLALEIVTGEVTGLPDLDLGAMLATTTRVGLEAEWVSRGSRIRANGLQLDVLWPPPNLQDGLSVLVARAVAAFDELASANQHVAETLRTVRAHVPIVIEGASPNGRYSGKEPDADNLLRLDHADTPEVDSSMLEVGGEEEESLHGEPRRDWRLLEGFDDESRSLLRQAARVFRTAANHMSLVIATPARDFVSWGDAPRGVVRWVERHEPAREVHSRVPRLSLAPHHGSQGPNSAFGGPTHCISSVGDRLYDRWVAYHRGCDAAICFDTHSTGDLWFT